MSFFRNKGERYESLIEYVYQQLSLASDRDIDVKRNVKVTGKSGVEHQVDVYYEFEQNDVLHKVLIECKNHNKKVTKGMLQSFKAVLDDVSNSIGIFASYTGFQSGAIDFANHYGIELINGSETAMLSRTIIKNLEILIPDENVNGQPFYMVMDVQNGRLTGSHITINDGYTPLFFSKMVAEKVAKSTGGEVREVSQKHLFKLLNLLEITNAKTLVFPLDTNSGLVMPIDDIRKFYLT